MWYAVPSLALLMTMPAVSTAQDLTVSLVRLHVVTHSLEPTTHLEVQAATRIASLTGDRHPLRLALYWGSWRCTLPQPFKATDPPDRRRAHQLGIRLMHSPTSSRLQPFVIVGYASEFGADSIDERYHIHMIETGIALSYAIYPSLRLHTTGSLYHLLVSGDDPAPGHNQLKVGLTFGRL